MAKTEAPVTVVVDRTVLPGKAAEFETYLDAIRAAAEAFPGSLGSEVIQPGGGDRYILVFRFASQKELDAWSASEPRNHWVDKIDQIIEAPTKLIAISGLETWFYADEAKGFRPPPKFKMALITYIAIAPTIMLFNLAFGRFFEFAPSPWTIFLTAPFIVLLMTYLVMPAMTKLFSGFLFPDSGEK
jgi:antibiotic biosynthesis monooxygenase (ABM) superfamily enzyme